MKEPKMGGTTRRVSARTCTDVARLNSYACAYVIPIRSQISKTAKLRITRRSSKAESTIHIILNAGIEAILARTDNDAEFDRRFREVESRLQGKNVDQFLKMLLKQRRTLK